MPPLLPAAQRFRPDFVLVSAGFDSRQSGRLGRFNVTDQGFASMTRLVAKMAAQHAQGRLVSVLEAGYNAQRVGLAVHAHLQALAEQE